MLVPDPVVPPGARICGNLIMITQTQWGPGRGGPQSYSGSTRAQRRGVGGVGGGGSGGKTGEGWGRGGGFEGARGAVRDGWGWRGQGGGQEGGWGNSNRRVVTFRSARTCMASCLL